MAALTAALVLCCAGSASAATVAPRTAVLGADDVAGLSVGSTSAAPWVALAGGRTTAGSHASSSVLRSSGVTKLLIVSRALVAPNPARASAFKRALGDAGKAAANRADARALGVNASALRDARRVVWREGPVVGELVAVGAPKGDALVGRLQDIVRSRVRRAVAQSAWDALQARVAARGGRPDAATAQQAFALAVAHLPGVRVPKGPRGSIPEGTLATSWVLANYGRLTPRVRQAVDRVLRRAFGLSGSAAPAGGALNAVKDQAVAFVGQQSGVALTLPVTIVRGYPSTARGAAALGVDASGSYRSDKPAARCIVSVRRGGASKTVIAHEVFHCLQIQLAGRANALLSLDAERAWLGEGSASYAGCLFSQDGAAPYRRAYGTYLEQPLTPLGSRTYDAIGFFANLDRSGMQALATTPAALAKSTLLGAYPAAGNEGGPDIFGAWASSLYRTPERGSAWDVGGPCAPPRSRAAEPIPIVLSGNAPVTLSAPAYAAHPYELFTDHTPAGAITVHPASGHVRVAAAGVDAQPTTDSVYCLGKGPGDNPAIAVGGTPERAKVTISATDASQACGPGGTATCQAKLCLPFAGASSVPPGAGPGGSGPLSPTPPHVNQIVAENAKPGTPDDVWDIPGGSDPDMQGYATNISYNLGETAQFKISSNKGYRIDIYRMGYYGGDGARRVARLEGFPANVQTDCPQTQPTTGLVECPWSVTASWPIPTDAVSGIYFAHLVHTDGSPGESHIYFVVRDDASTSDIYYQTSDTTWQAYNTYGGNSLYVGGPASNPARAYKVSYNRPFTTRQTGPEDFVYNAEYPMVRWLEKNGYDVSYETGVDTDRYGDLIKRHKVFMSTGHDEYWSGQQRANVLSARDAGVNLAFFSGNEMFWKTRWENNYRTLVCYKTTHNPGIDDPTGVWTGSWRDPAGYPTGTRPENELTGQIFTVNSGTTSIHVGSFYANQPFWRHIPAADLNAPFPEGTLGYEWDSDQVDELPQAARPPGFTQPAGLTELSSTQVSVPERISDYGHTYGPGTVTHNLTIYRAPSGALVFGAGTVQWSWGLDPNHDRQPNPQPDSRMEQATVNLFSDMGAQPTTLQSNLVPG